MCEEKPSLRYLCGLITCTLHHVCNYNVFANRELMVFVCEFVAVKSSNLIMAKKLDGFPVVVLLLLIHQPLDTLFLLSKLSILHCTGNRI
jgi:hypothetical protein